MNIYKLLLASSIVCASPFGASAATILTADDFTLIGGQTQNSAQCPGGVGPCTNLTPNGPNQNAELTFSGGVFTLTGFFYSSQGSNTEVTATSAGGTVSSIFIGPGAQGSSTDIFADLTASSIVAGFTNITSVSFSNTGNGTVRIGGFAGEAPTVISAVPLPASGLLLLGVLGAGLAAGRKKAA